jgi:hypothetical protein
MRLLSRLLIVLVVCLIAMALPAVPAQAAGTEITLSPISGVPGDTVRVYGYNFTPNKWVDIYYCLNTTCLNTTRTWVAEVETDEYGDFEKTFTVPESYKGDHKVRAEEDSPSAYVAEAIFTVKPGLTVSPEEGPVGTNVTVEGHGFAKDEMGIELRYYLNSTSQAVAQNISANDDGWCNWTFLIPPSAMGNHKLDAKSNNSSLAAVQDAFFKVTPGISLDEPSGSVGENITMTGDGFYARERDIKILFADQEVSTDPLDVRADDSGHWSAAFQVPEMSKGTYNVTAYGESTPKAAVTALSFEIKPGLVLSPGEGHVDMDLTVTGHGFATDKEVVIKYDGSEKARTTTDAKGSFSGVTFPVPEGIHGAHQVTAEDAAGNNATAIFTMESVPPPVPELESPLDTSRVGFVGKVRPTFEWSAVSDPSGVRYSLQIAPSANVTTTGFVNPVVSVTDLVGTNYTLNATEALPYGTYYWIAQAVDRAENAGNWTAAYSFRAGLLPLWAFILIIVAIVVLIGALVYFFIIRRRTYYY